MDFKEVLKYFNVKNKNDLNLLAEALEILPKDLKNCEFKKEDDYLYANCWYGEFLVFDDYDAVEEYAERELYNIYRECYEQDIPANLRSYVDIDRWAYDIIRFDGAGSVIASYDGDEREINLNGWTYYIYRTN